MTRFGVILSSGGTRGVFAHTGFMAALKDLGLQVTASSGCSAGAIVGAVIASGTSVGSWVEAITRVRTDQFWSPFSTWRFLWGLLVKQGRGLTGLSDTARAVKFIEEQLEADRFEDCIYPFTSIAVNLETVDKHMFSSGPLAPAAMASAAIPGFYAPVEIDGRLYCDGAIIDLAPAEAICCRYSLDVLLIHHVQLQEFTREGLSRALGQPWPLVGLLQRLLFRRRPWYATGRAIDAAPCPCGCKAVVVVVEPVLPELQWPMTDGGEIVLATAKSHAMGHLGPWVERLQREPRSLLSE